MAAPQPTDWNQIPSIDAYQDTSGGVYSGVEPYYLQPNQAAYLQNADLDQLGARRKRLGCAAYGAAGATCWGLGSYYPFFLAGGAKYLLGVWDSNVWRSAGDKQWARQNDTGISLVAHTLYSIAEGQSVEFHAAPTSTTNTHNSIFLCGVYPNTGLTNTNLYVVHNDMDATSLSLMPRALTWWQGRLWLFNLSNPDYSPSTLMWSKILDGWNIDTTNNIEINPSDGDEGVAIVPSRGSTPRLYLFKRNSIYALDVVWGSGAYIPSTENTLDTTNSRLVLVSENVGCVAPKTVVYTSGSENADIFFLAADGFRSLKRVEQDVAGGAGLAISEPIRDVIDRINWTHAKKAVAREFEQKIFLAVPVDGSETNNLVLVFDLVKKQWVGEYTWSPTDIYAYENPQTSTQQMWLAWGVKTGETLTGLGYTEGAHIFQALATGEYYDPGHTDVTYEEQTRAFVYDNYGQKKRWNWVELLMEPAVTYATVSIYAKVDEFDWGLIGRVGLEPIYEYPILPAQLPWNFEQSARQVNRLNLMDVPPGQRIQFKVEATAPSTFGIRMLRVAGWPMAELWED
jgi:hypothetical protein